MLNFPTFITDIGGFGNMNIFYMPCQKHPIEDYLSNGERVSCSAKSLFRGSLEGGQYEQNNSVIYGGCYQDDRFMRFQKLGVPVGIVVRINEREAPSYEQVYDDEEDEGVLAADRFDELFNRAIEQSREKYMTKRKTRSKRKTGSKKDKKRKTKRSD